MVDQISDLLMRKIEGYCSYQERCIQDVVVKLHEWKVQPLHVSRIIERLKNTGFVNEERFVRAYALGKFHQNKWGKNKIYRSLVQKQIPELFIGIGIGGIDQEEYEKTLKKLIRDKAKDFLPLKKTDPEKFRYQIASSMIGKGFEAALTWHHILEIFADKPKK